MDGKQVYCDDVLVCVLISLLSFCSSASRGTTLSCVYQTMNPPMQGVIGAKPVTFFPSMFPLFADSMVDI
jgi:hypothetical protein